MLVGPAALPLFCLAPHGVFRASRITPRAVSSYLAISPLPVLENNSCCFKEPAVSFLRHFPATPTWIGAARVFYAACCRMVFGLSSSESRRSGTHQRSSAIARILAHRVAFGMGFNERRGLVRRTEMGRIGNSSSLAPKAITRQWQ